MEKELRKKLEQEIANSLKSLLKEKNPAAFDKMEKHIDEAARSLAKRFVKVRNKLLEVTSVSSGLTIQKTAVNDKNRPSAKALSTTGPKAKSIAKKTKPSSAVSKVKSTSLTRKGQSPAKTVIPAKKSSAKTKATVAKKAAGKSSAAKK